ncbi:MAG: uracil phosphoribosyltransferase [Bacteroidetes bacterium]|nr:uracil phosphoribosyltransferase [Bacteroidota bacterium]MBM3424691.1 uracil phosphoribosyltransferase [Bacteroidota bacterium]
MIYNLSEGNSLLGNYMAELRDVETQRDPMRFRLNMERIAEIIGYEISKSLPYKSVKVETPLGISEERVLKEQPVLVTILRAGLAMHSGLMRCYDRAESAFVSAYRKHLTPEEFEIYVEYMAAPNLDGRIWILSDPMLATGNSMNTVYDALVKVGIPKKIYVVTALSTYQAIERVKNHFPPNTVIYTAAIDEELTAQAYIVPGLGDAGDLAFGVKV